MRRRSAGRHADRLARQPAKRPGASPAAAAKAAPPDVDAMRRELARKLSMFRSEVSAGWRRCPHGLCRRRRGCQPPEVFCVAPLPEGPPMTRDEERAMLADLKRELARRLGLFAAEPDGESDA